MSGIKIVAFLYARDEAQGDTYLKKCRDWVILGILFSVSGAVPCTQAILTRSANQTHLIRILPIFASCIGLSVNINTCKKRNSEYALNFGTLQFSGFSTPIRVQFSFINFYCVVRAQ